VAAVLLDLERLDAERFGELARRRLAVLDAGRAVCDPEEGATDPDLEREAILEMARARGLTVEEIDGPATPVDPEARSVCPICRAAYVTATATCADCGVETRSTVAA
jgi:hypothetical protein